MSERQHKGLLERETPLTPPRASPMPRTARKFQSSSSVINVDISYGNVTSFHCAKSKGTAVADHSFPFVPRGTCQRAGELRGSSATFLAFTAPTTLPPGCSLGEIIRLKASTGSLFPSEFSKLVFHLLLHIFLNIPIYTKYCQTRDHILNETACANACTCIFSRLLLFFHVNKQAKQNSGRKFKYC